MARRGGYRLLRDGLHRSGSHIRLRSASHGGPGRARAAQSRRCPISARTRHRRRFGGARDRPNWRLVSGGSRIELGGPPPLREGRLPGCREAPGVLRRASGSGYCHEIGKVLMSSAGVGDRTFRRQLHLSEVKLTHRAFLGFLTRRGNLTDWGICRNGHELSRRIKGAPDGDQRTVSSSG